MLMKRVILLMMIIFALVVGAAGSKQPITVQWDKETCPPNPSENFYLETVSDMVRQYSLKKEVLQINSQAFRTLPRLLQNQQVYISPTNGYCMAQAICYEQGPQEVYSSCIDQCKKANYYLLQEEASGTDWEKGKLAVTCDKQ
ncbi:MAG: hypothetical protein A3F10_07360 [Coxiella sp. RIFCSPHIGHO2_12_FULL_42_15]|nr:MAG: hypothetical protein A3F10_07360 [Coxiella sp. RIFCSPHIGHO2_12_FULL_42_15]